MRALYVNVSSTGGLSESLTTGTRCSVYEAGLTYFQALAQSELFTFDYCDASALTSCEEYDLVVFAHMAWRLQVPLSYIQAAKRTMAIVIEADRDVLAARCDYGPIGAVYTYVATPDPTAQSQPPKVLALPRSIWRFDGNGPAPDLSRPVVSTYGLPSADKRLDLMLGIIKRDMPNALFRIKFSQASFQPDDWFSSQLALVEDLRAKADGVEIQLFTEYLPRSDLVAWLAQSDLNIFVSDISRQQYTRYAIAASTDQAIAAQKPILVSDTGEFRHIHEHQSPWPKIGALDAIQQNQQSVDHMYREWSPQAFAKRFDAFMEAVG